MRNFIMCTLIVLLVGCGAQPTKPATSETSSNVTPAAPTPQADAASAASAQAATAAPGQPAPAGVAGEKPPVKPPPGFRVTKRDGQVYYCRSEATIGSKLKEELCYTQDQLDEIARRADEVMDVIGHGCQGAACGGT
jgi:hypothetical protein